MANRHPKEWSAASDRLRQILEARRLTNADLNVMVAKATGSPRTTTKVRTRDVFSGQIVVSYVWVVVASVLGLKLRNILDDHRWADACQIAYADWVENSDLGKRTEHNRITQAIWTNKLTGEQIDPATATQAQKEKPMPDPSPVKEAPASAPAPTRQASLNDNKEWVIMRVATVPSIVEIAAQFEVAQKRLAAAAAEHKAAQDAIETLRAQLAEAIKA